MMKHLLCACFLILVCDAQAQRLVRPFNTISDMQLSNPGDPNTNVATVAPFKFWTWYKGNLDVPNGTDTLNSQWLGAPAGNWKLQGSLLPEGSGGSTNIIFGNTNVIVITVQTIAQLKALNPCAGIGTVFVQGYYEPGRGGRQVVWKPNDPTPDDGFLVFRPNNELGCSGTWTSVFPQGTFTGFSLDLAGGLATNFSYNAVRDYTVSVGGAPLIWPRVASIVDTTTNSLAIVSNESMSGEDGNQIVGNSTNAVFFGHDGTNVSIKGVGISGGITGIILSNWNGGIIEGCHFSSLTNGIVLLGTTTNITIRNNVYDSSVLNTKVIASTCGSIKEDETEVMVLPPIFGGVRSLSFFGNPNGSEALIKITDMTLGDADNNQIFMRHKTTNYIYTMRMLNSDAFVQSGFSAATTRTSGGATLSTASLKADTNNAYVSLVSSGTAAYTNIFNSVVLFAGKGPPNPKLAAFPGSLYFQSDATNASDTSLWMISRQSSLSSLTYTNWVPVISVAGTNTMLQFNDSGVMGASSRVTFDKAFNQFQVNSTYVLPSGNLSFGGNAGLSMIYLSAGSIAYGALHASLIADNFTADPTGGSGGYSAMEFDSDNATPANRTIHLHSGFHHGQPLIITCLSNGMQVLNNDTLTDTAGTIRLGVGGDWNATAGSTLSLMFDGANWDETGRSIH